MDETDDELLLDDQIEADEPDEIEEPVGDDGDPDVNDVNDGDESDDVAFSFGDEPSEEAPSESESPVLRHLRKHIKTLTRENRDLRAKAPATAAPQDPGPRPTLAACDFDEERHEEALDQWDADRAAFNASVQQQEAYNSGLKAAYDAEKTKLAYPGMERAETNVFGAASETLQRALVYAKSPALVAALDRAPAQMAALEEITNPAELLLAIGELKGKLRMSKGSTRSRPQPEEKVRGSASMGAGGDKQEQRLEREADKTGDRSALIRYRASKQKAV